MARGDTLVEDVKNELGLTAPVPGRLDVKGETQPVVTELADALNEQAADGASILSSEASGTVMAGNTELDTSVMQDSAVEKDAALGIKDTANDMADAVEQAEKSGKKNGPSKLEEMNPETVPHVSKNVSKEVRADTTRIGDDVRIKLPFPSETPAAVFSRGQTLWAVFDTPLPIDARTIRIETADISRSVTFSRYDDALVMRMDLTKNVLVTAAKEDNTWIITVGDMVLQPADPLTIKRAIHADGRPYAIIPTLGVSSMHWIDDPAIGDRIGVVTTTGDPVGFLKPFHMVEFNAIVTAQGIAIIPKTDDLDITLDGDNVLVSRSEGLALSETGAALNQSRFQGGERAGFIDLKYWRLGGEAMFMQTLDKMLVDLSLSDKVLQPDRLLDITRFYLAHELGEEAIGVMRYARQLKPSLEQDKSFLILEAAAHVLADRPHDALKFLAEGVPTSSLDGAVWRMLANASLERWVDVRNDLENAKIVLDDYPLLIRAKIYLAAAAASMELNDAALASEYLARINLDKLPDTLKARHLVLSARVNDALGRSNEAVSFLKMAEKLDSGPEAARATLYRIQILRREGDMSNDDALAALERLTAGWRGDLTELTARNILARLYAANGEYRDAFSAMKDAVMADSDAPVVQDLHDNMTNVFVDLFLNGEADKMPALEALSIFYDFRELTPIGRQGDELVRRLADRLVEVDLLGQAADLLHHQVDKRLTGAARAQVATDLAVIYLLDHKPNEAIRILHQTRLSELPEELERERRKVEARALSEAGRVDLALELLKKQEGSDIALLRADVLWNAQRWQEAAEILERNLGDRWKEELELSETERMQVLQSAIAYSLAEDPLGLERVRRKFAGKMANSSDASSFEIVTARIEAQGAEFRTIARQIAAVDTLKNFLEEYRSRYLNQGNVDKPQTSGGPGNPAA
jgi:hypothetical protein